MPRKDNVTRVWIRAKLIEQIIEDGKNFFPLETGGILLGYKSSLTEFVITNIVGPGPRALHKATSFSPDQIFQKREIARVYNESGRIETYLGDWHTHPNSTPYLSDRDIKTLETIATFKRARISTPIMLVVALPSVDVKAWNYQDTSPTVIQVKIMLY